MKWWQILIIKLCGCNHDWWGDSKTGDWVCHRCDKRYSVLKGLPPRYRT